jgi:hypothetical protein
MIRMIQSRLIERLPFVGMRSSPSQRFSAASRYGGSAWVGPILGVMPHDARRWSVWFKAEPGLQGALVGASPERYFVPPYAGHHGRIGAYLDVDQDWDELAGLIEDSYCRTAPKRLVALLGA